jgi:hypothetical protein
MPSNIELPVYHSKIVTKETETLQPADELFHETIELDFKSLDKQFSIKDADFSDCPPQELPKIKKLLEDFADRFSTTKLDIETTTLYEAELPTMPGKKVCQPLRRLPPHKFAFAMKAIKQLEAAKVISKSDSNWRSNVVLVPKPVSSNEIRANTKAEQLTGSHNASQLYRICLDFRELNTVLDFPQLTQFTTLDSLLQKLKNKVVISLDISSAFFIIPIKPEDRYKTAFWLNELSYEFNSLVMGLKSSPYHLYKFLEKVYSPETLEKIKKDLPENEQNLLPQSFDDFLGYYFDDFFCFAPDYDTLLVCFKAVLLAARIAGIKFSIEKSSFFTTKIKILGYSFDTKDVILMMDQLKASAFANMKKPMNCIVD